MVQLRDAYVRQVIATKLRIKSLLLFEAIPFPEILGNSWTNASLAKLKVLPCSQVVRFKLDQLLSTLEFLHKKNLETTREIRRFCHQDPAIERNIKLLRSIPGIGWITSSQLLARIGDPNYLRHVRQIAAFLGVVPRENSTGEVIHRGSITRMGNSSPRNKLIQSAWVSIRIDPELRQFYERIRGRHPKNQASGKAIVAVARKLTTRIFSVLHEQRPYVIRHPKINNPLTQEETVPRERLEVKSEKT